MDSEMEKIRQRIKSRREELSITYQELADKTGMSKSTLQRYETSSIKNIGLDKLEILANALDITPAFLLGWEEPKAKEEKPKPKPKSSLTRQEKILVIRYRALDEYGAKAVNDLLETEYKRVQDSKLLYDDNGNRITNFSDYINYKYKKDTSLYIDKVSAGLGYYPYEQDHQPIGSPVSGADYAFQVDGDSMFPSYHNGDMVYIRRQSTLENGEIGIVSYNNKGYLKQFYKDEDTITLVSVNEDYEDMIITIDEDTAFNIIGKVIGRVAVSEFLR